MMDLISINAQFFRFGLKYFATYSEKKIKPTEENLLYCA